MPRLSLFSLQPSHATPHHRLQLASLCPSDNSYATDNFRSAQNRFLSVLIQSGPASQRNASRSSIGRNMPPVPSQQYSRKFSSLCSIPLPLLNLLQRLHGAVQRVLVVSSELRVCAFERGVSVGFGLVDARRERLLVLSCRFSLL